MQGILSLTDLSGSLAGHCSPRERTPGGVLTESHYEAAPLRIEIAQSCLSELARHPIPQPDVRPVDGQDAPSSGAPGDTAPWVPQHPAPRLGGVPRLLKDLRQTGLFPDCLSLWLAVCNPGAGTSQLPAATRIVLDRTFYSDSSPGGERGEATNIAFGTIDKQVIELQLVYHPLCIVQHPFEQAGLATRLWPNPPDQLDLPTHPTLSATGLDQWKNVFLIGKSAFGVRPRHAIELNAAAGTPADPLLMPKEICLHP